MKAIFTILFSLVVGFVLSAQTTRYVAVSGNNSGNNCTNPNNPCATVQHAIGQANPGDIIQIANGVYTENITVNKSVEIKGESQESTFLQAHAQPNQSGAGKVISISGGFIVHISDVTVRNGHLQGSSFGAGIYVSGATVTVENITLKNNRAVAGAGMENNNGILNIENTLFEENWATSDAGGLRVRNGGQSVLNNVVFNGNSGVYGSGGMGVYEASSNASLNNVHFLNNTTQGTGGGLEIENTNNVTLTDVLFEGNTSTGSDSHHGGGGLFLYQGGAVLENVQFKNNAATKQGGGMFCNNNSSPQLTNVLFENNTAQYGGGIYNNNNSSPQIENSAFLNNHALNNAGAIYNYENCSPVINTTIFENNTAGDNGGAIYNYNQSNPVLTRVTFLSNAAVNRGGGMHNNTNCTVYLYNVKFIENSANTLSGGGVYNGKSQTYMYNVVFAGNQAGNSGGGFINYDNAGALMYNVTFYNNEATNEGGAFSNYLSGMLTASNILLWENQAGAGNQVFLDATSSLHMDYSLYADTSNDMVGANFVIQNSIVNQDPLFVNVDTYNLLIGEGSPAIDSGKPYTGEGIFPTDENGDSVDIAENPRFVGTIDIGAYEWNEGLSVNEFGKELTLTIYPNPTKELVHIQSDKTITKVYLYNLVGQYFAVNKIRSDENTIILNVSEIPTGVYLLKIEAEGITESYKIIKK